MQIKGDSELNHALHKGYKMFLRAGYRLCANIQEC